MAILKSDTPFTQRKQDHIRLALDPANQASARRDLDSIELVHNALPDLNFAEITLATQCLGKPNPTPFLVSSMTAGHQQAQPINLILAKACAARGWMMGVGSQRRQLDEPEAAEEWQALSNLNPRPRLLGNIGIAQVIHTPTERIHQLVESLQAEALFVHLNALQECLQPEGTPDFKGSLAALERLCRELPVPVIVKETGCGFAKATLQQLTELGVAAVDISGAGGTHWGRIEGHRNPKTSMRAQAAQTFKNWGISTVDSLLQAVALQPSYEIWASGGVRSGLDAAKLLALGATLVGIAKPMLEAALQGEEALDNLMATYEFELKVALFCTGCRTLDELRSNPYAKVIPN